MRRATLCIAGLFGLALTCGCGYSTRAGLPPSPARICEQAAEDSRGRARDAARRIEELSEQIAFMRRQHDELRRDANTYRANAASVWTDPRYGRRTREGAAEQWSALAIARDRQVQAITDLIRAYESSLTVLYGRKMDFQYAASRYDAQYGPPAPVQSAWQQ